MSYTGADDAKERVRQATDIVELVGGYMQLRRQGRGYVGLCPWHDDSKPSLQVNPDRQSFKCWVCDIGGDVFTFLMRIDGLEFLEALEQLADRAGIELKAAQVGPRVEPGSPGDKKTLLAAMAWATERYHRCLLEAQAAEPARAYLAERGITADAIQRFRLGFAPATWDWLLKQGPAAGYSQAVLDRVNLTTQRQSGEGWYDQFRGRVLFPIRDVRGRPVAIGGRIIPQLAEAEARPDYKPAKYVNSAETPIYTKSQTLYALDMAKEATPQLAELVVVEGYTDVIACHQAGVRNVVACCGTAMGEGHLKLVRRFTDRVVLALDGDEAGRRRASELLELFAASPVELRILTLPGGLDPCDFVASHGGDKFVALVAEAPDALEHLLQSVTEGMVLSADNTHAVSRAVERILAPIARMRPVLGEAASAVFLREQSMLGTLSRRFRLPEESLRARLADLRRNAQQKPLTQQEASEEPTATRMRAGDVPAWEREALELMLLGVESAEAVAQAIDEVDFTEPAACALFVALREAAEMHAVPYDHAMLTLEDASLKTLLIEIDESAAGRSQSNPAARYRDLIEARTRRHEGAERGQKISAVRTGELSDSDADEAVAALFASRKRRETGSPSTDGQGVS